MTRENAERRHVAGHQDVRPEQLSPPPGFVRAQAVLVRVESREHVGRRLARGGGQIQRHGSTLPQTRRHVAMVGRGIPRVQSRRSRRHRRSGTSAVPGSYFFDRRFPPNAVRAPSRSAAAVASRSVSVLGALTGASVGVSSASGASVGSPARPRSIPNRSSPARPTSAGPDDRALLDGLGRERRTGGVVVMPELSPALATSAPRRRSAALVDHVAAAALAERYRWSEASLAVASGHREGIAEDRVRSGPSATRAGGRAGRRRGD